MRMDFPQRQAPVPERKERERVQSGRAVHKLSAWQSLHDMVMKLQIWLVLLTCRKGAGQAHASRV